jgi:hypothetical protein
MEGKGQKKVGKKKNKNKTKRNGKILVSSRTIMTSYIKNIMSLRVK